MCLHFWENRVYYTGKCRCVGIGRRSGLKIHRWQHRAGSSPATGTIKSKRYRCHWRKASGINRFRAFSARKFTDDSIDANRCFPLTGRIRTPFFRRLAYSEPCGALFEAVIFKKGAIFLSIEYTKFEASICWSRRAIRLAPFLLSDKFKKGTKYQEVVNEPRTVFSGASHRSPP